MKMYAILSVALLMSGIAQAAQINVVNKSDKTVYARLQYKQVVGGTTGGKATQGCEAGQTGDSGSMVARGKTQTITFNSCVGKANVIFYATTATNQKEIEAKLGMGAGPTRSGGPNITVDQITTNIGSVNGMATPTETYTVSHNASDAKGVLTVTKS
jgi:hypothetical protein